MKRDSFTKIEHKVLPGLRQNLNRAESTEDVRKFFYYAVKELFGGVLERKVDLAYEEVSLIPDGKPPFSIGRGLMEMKEFQAIWKSSDLPQVVTRFAESACGRYKRLQKNPEKTEAKIRKK